MNIFALVALIVATILTPSAAVDLAHVLSDINEAVEVSVEATRSDESESERVINACTCSSNNMKVLVTSMGGTWRHTRT
jgi:hypothetical protein